MSFQKGNPYRFKPGKSGNPLGRPKKKTLQEEVMTVLGELADTKDGKKIEKMQKLARGIVKKGLDGDVATITLLAKRLWPEVNKHELSGTLGIEQQVADAATELDRLLGINNADEEPADGGRPDTEHSLN